MKVVCFRTDRIGDVVLTLPAMKALADAGHEVSAVVSPLTAPLAAGQPFLREVLEWNHSMPTAPLIGWLRRNGFDAAVCFFPRPVIAWALLQAGVPVRVGTAYRWYSFLFNRRVAVHRSAQNRHEAEFNFELLAPLGVGPSRIELVRPVFGSLGPADLPGRFAVIHPIGGGSALNATLETWGRIGEGMEAAGLPVVFTGAPGDRASLKRLGSVRIVTPMGLDELCGVLSRAEVVVGPSTGPVHLAAALGRPVVALYPPLKSQHLVRWRPYSAAATVLTPHEAVCPSCLGTACPIWNCVDRIAPDRVVAAAIAAAI